VNEGKKSVFLCVKQGSPGGLDVSTGPY